MVIMNSVGTEVTNVAGTTTGLGNVDGISVGGTVTDDTTTVMVPITEVGTDDGTAGLGIMTTVGEFGMVTMSDGETDVTSVYGTITGDVNVDGIIEAGTVIVETTMTGVIITIVGTDDGTLLLGMMTIDGDPGMVTITDGETDVTSVAGTITGLEIYVGIIEAGTVIVG
jgi:hypothetical protein